MAFEISMYDEPWKYGLVENFLSNEHFDKLIDFSKGINIGRTQKIFFSHKVSNGRVTQRDLFPEDFVIELHDSYCDVLNRYLSATRPSKSYLLNYYDISLQISGPDFQDKIHLDVPRKLVSGVVYLQNGPLGAGTLMYDVNGNIDSEVVVPWCVNRAMFFCRDTSSWHSYRGNGKNNRVTLIYNACTNWPKFAKVIDRLMRKS